jgi:hypothetical protein
LDDRGLFKQSKQTLKLADFPGHSANAVRWQTWTAILGHLRRSRNQVAMLQKADQAFPFESSFSPLQLNFSARLILMRL